MKQATSILAVTALFVGAAQAETVTVHVEGQVVFNAIADPPLSGVNFGDSAVISFTVDSTNFVDGVPGDVRGYVIDQSSFSLSFAGGDIVQGLLSPFPAGQTPYFGLVDGFPVSDGFYVSTSPVSPGGVPLEQEPFNANFEVGYTGDTLSSLNILDALGTYDFTGLTSFGFNLWAFSPDNVALDIDFSQMTISGPPPLGRCCQGGFAGIVCLVNTEAECMSSGQFISWLEGENCDIPDVCDPAPLGRCCQGGFAGIVCLVNTEAECMSSGQFISWTEGENCDIPDVCDPVPLGRCCQGGFAGNVCLVNTEAECMSSGQFISWVEGENCDVPDVCDPAPLGRCCQGGFAGIVCLVNTEAECMSSGQFISWTEGENCDVPDVCDPAPLGRCCQGGFAGTVCLVNTEAECMSSGQFISWTEGENCDDPNACEPLGRCCQGGIAGTVCLVNTEAECMSSGQFISWVEGENCDDPGACDTDPDEMVTICHTPPGNPAKRRTIQVGASAVPAHLAHGDTLGPCCPGDLNADGVVGVPDLLMMLEQWGSQSLDLTGDGTVDGKDVVELLSNLGDCP